MVDLTKNIEMLTKIKIVKLFNLFDYEIELKDEGVTIITGPNGYGKTTILNIIHAFAYKNALFFIRLIFEKIIFYTDDYNYTIIKDQLGIHVYEGGSMTSEINKKTIEKYSINKLRKNTHEIDDINWDSYNNKNYLSFNNNDFINIKKFNENFISNFNNNFNNNLTLNVNSNFKVYLIKEQRLFRKNYKLNTYYESTSREKYTEAIEQYAQELKIKIFKVNSKYSQQSQILDSSFPRRLFEQNNEVSLQEFNSRFERIKEIQKSLTKYEFSIIQEDNHPTYKKENAKALLIYLHDTEHKLEVFAELIRKLDLFTDILNNRRLTFKQIKIDSECGFKIVTNQNGETLSLTDLSSGEQQEIILLYELLFKTSKNTLVLIDEPEISLHVAWQKEFLSDLKKVVEIQNIKVAIATHSPQIINGNWDLTIDLEELHNAKIS